MNIRLMAALLVLCGCGDDDMSLDGGVLTMDADFDAATVDAADLDAADLDATPGDGGADAAGSDAGDPPAACTRAVSPGDSFVEAFAAMVPGDMLCLADGVYRQMMDIPSGMHVRAEHDGMAEIDGGGTLGTEWEGGLLQMLGDGSSVRGLRVHHAGPFSNTCQIGGTNNTMRVMSCAHGGSHKHKVPIFVGGSGHLIEDSWAFGEGRYVVQCFRGEDITFRRNVARWDSTTPDEPTEPNAAFSIYNCANITIENNISLDYGVPETRMRFGGDFYSPQNRTIWPMGNHDNHFLGNIAINHARDTDNRRGLRIDPDGTAADNVVTDFYVRGSDIGILINPRTTGSVRTCTMVDVGEIGSWGRDAITCTGTADIERRYVDRVETEAALFPWPNEALVRADMCRDGERQSDWCASGQSLSDYVLNPM